MVRPSLREQLTQRQQQRAQTHALRRLHPAQAREGVRLRRNGRWLRVFCSNDYLGLADDPRLVEALRKAVSDYGVGSTAAHLVNGHHRAHAALEEAVADWLGHERALLLGSGFMANVGVIQALLDADGLCVQDRLNHASLIDGARQSGALLKRYPHADVEGAQRQLRSAPDRVALLATDGVFSMDGDVAPLAQLARIAEDEGALCYVDDAHGIGVLGPQGRGSPAACGVQMPLHLVTLGKALGAYGAVVAGEADLIEAILQGARSYLFTTALPPALAVAGLEAVRIARIEDDRRQQLDALIARFVSGAQQLGLPLLPSHTPIQPLLIGDNARCLVIAAALEQAGFLVAAIRPPTVPAGQARLRITLSAAHRESDIDALLDALPVALAHSEQPS